LVFFLYCLIFSIYFFPVLTHLNTYVYGIIGDNFWWFIWGWWSKNYQSLGFNDIYHNALYGIGGFEHIYWNSTHPLGWGIASELIKNLPTNFAYNMLVLPTFPLAAFFAYLLFYHLTKNKYISFAFGLIFSFSPYHIFSSQRHTELAITWVIPLVIWTFLIAFEKKTFKYIFLASFSLALTMLSSIYWGVYLVVFTFCLWISLAVVELLLKSGFQIKFGMTGIRNLWKKYLSFYVVYLLLFTLIAAPFLFSYIKANYFQEQDMTRGWVYQNTMVVKRGLADFMLYSIMPYHFIIPPSENPITGEVGKKMVLFIKDNWGYFMAKNYVFSEHGGDYLGIANICLFTVAIFFAIKRMLLYLKCQSSKLKAKSQILKSGVEERCFLHKILIFATGGLLLYMFAMPPYFTISGFKIYTPAYLIYTFFPMLRTLSRMGVIIFLCVLCVNAIFLSQMSKLKTQSQISKLKSGGIILIFILITLAEFYMPLKYLDDTVPPPAYAYIGTKEDSVKVDYVTDKGREYKYTGPSFVVEYPWGYDIAAFYQKYHKKGFANPLFYVNPYLKFNGIEFSYELDSAGGIKKAYDLGIRYVIYHKGDEDTIKRVQRGEDPEGFFKEHSKSFKDFGEIIVFEL
ncbi:MAG: hypothetical protein ABIJ36_03010, partial [Patescibacteria group bacterium]